MTEAVIRLKARRVHEYRSDLAAFSFEVLGSTHLADLQWAPGQVASLHAGGQESYFAIASSPQDREGIDFLVRRGTGVSDFLFAEGVGALVNMTGPMGTGFPVDSYRGRDLLLICVGTAIAPVRSVIRSILHRRDEFGRIVVIYGVRNQSHFAYQDEIEAWRRQGIKVIMTVSQPDGGLWDEPTGYVQHQLDVATSHLSTPVTLVCGMQEMMDETARELGKRHPDSEILTNY